MGRTSLSCYVFQNLVAAVLCYGWGFGLATRFADARPWWVIGAWTGICALLMTLSVWWLRRFDRGPLELLAHRAYQAPQPPGTGPLWALDALKARVTEPGAVLYTGSVTLPGHRLYDWQQGFDVEHLLAGDWGVAADSLVALGHPVRLVLLQAVLRGTATAAGLAGIEGLGTSGQLYHHLRHLVAAGWLRSPGRGRYEVPAERVIALLVVVAAGTS